MIATPPGLATSRWAATLAQGTRRARRDPSSTTTANGPSGSGSPACSQTQPPMIEVSVSGTGAA